MRTPVRTLPPPRARETGGTHRDELPWAPVPTWDVRQAMRRNSDFGIEIVFPTVYEEDRTEKIKDLATANAFGAITHERASEQIAKELGVEDYNYTAELDAIEQELKKLPQAILGAADAIAGATKGGGGGGGGSISIGAPSPGLASEDEDDDVPVHRADLSGSATRDFRRQQRSPSSAAETEARLAEAQSLVGTLAKRDRRVRHHIRTLAESLQVVNDLRAHLSSLVESAQHATTQERERTRETVAEATQTVDAVMRAFNSEFERLQAVSLQAIAALREAATRTQPAPVVNVAPPHVTVEPADVHVESPSITVNPPDITIEMPEPRSMTRRVERDEHGLITQITDEPSEEDTRP